LHSQDVKAIITISGIVNVTTWHEIGNAEAKLFFYDSVSKRKLFLQMLNVVISLLNVKLSPIFLSFDINLLKIKQMLIV
jgi:hypothetical protein